MTLAFLLFAVTVIRLHPHTPAARWLHDGLVERPLARWERLERRHIIAAVLLVGMGMAGVGTEITWLMAMDSALLMDLTIALWTLGTVRGIRTAWSAVSLRFVSAANPNRRSAKPRQPRRTAAVQKPANDDGEVRHAA